MRATRDARLGATERRRMRARESFPGRFVEAVGRPASTSRSGQVPRDLQLCLGHFPSTGRRSVARSARGLSATLAARRCQLRDRLKQLASESVASRAGCRKVPGGVMATGRALEHDQATGGLVPVEAVRPETPPLLTASLAGALAALVRNAAARPDPIPETCHSDVVSSKGS